MLNAVDMFRAQRDAAEGVQRTLQETTALVAALRQQVDALASDQHLRGLIRDERALLERAEAFLDQVRYVREREIARFWPAVWRRWLAAVAFALASATAAGAGAIWVSRPRAGERERSQARRELADAIIERMQTMTPAERHQLDALMKWRRGNVESPRAER